MKFKTNRKRVLIITTMIMTTALILSGNVSKAAMLQANSTTQDNPKTKYGSDWISEIRAMETGTMGLTETLKEDLSPNESNNIDVHMMKTTEYGAMAILSASGYGNPKMLSEVTPKTTTGNVTGVYIKLNYWEWTAGTNSRAAGSVNTRYYDNYTTTKGEAKVGDALGLADNKTAPGCAIVYGERGSNGKYAWHGANHSSWISSTYGRIRAWW